MPYTPLGVVLLLLAGLQIFKCNSKPQTRGRTHADFSRLWTLHSWNKFQIPAAFCLSKEDKLSGLLNTAWVFRQDLENSRSSLRRDIKHPVTLSMRTKMKMGPFLTLPKHCCLVPVSPRTFQPFSAAIKSKCKAPRSAQAEPEEKVAGRPLLHCSPRLSSKSFNVRKHTRFG